MMSGRRSGTHGRSVAGTAAQPLTFVLRTPPLEDEAVGDFQRTLNHRYRAWEINKRIAEDDVYGRETPNAAREVCTGLGIRHQTAMRNGVTPALRIKFRHPGRRTAGEIKRSKSKAAREFRARLRWRFATPKAGLTVFDGVWVAAWIVPSLRWAREHGWTGRVISGFRTCARQKRVAAEYAASKGVTVAQLYPNGPCASNHVGEAYPRGAVDVTAPAQLNATLRGNPNRPSLVWGGPVIGDDVHFSANGH